MFGMAGGSAGQFVVGPLISGGLLWNKFWIGMAILSFVLCIAFVVLLPKQESKQSSENWIKRAVHAFWAVFTNPQSIVCGLIAGLLFIPTTIFDMVWGVRYLQEGHGFDYGTAVLRSAMVPMGWIIGCPLLGFISDRIGRRKPVIAGGGLVLLACLAWILFGSPGVFPPYVIGLLAGIASGAAMVPYSVIKEANLPEFAGTATGVITFINFSLTALIGPMFASRLQSASGGSAQFVLTHYQEAFLPLLLGVGIAIGLTFLLKETGPAARTASPATQKEVLA
jgi:MFS family permease